ncbi:MAG: hypothetical protein OXR72_13780 [Gemmatimonadota bacterium]|nr:hypothetical protein [Gemmatimonadota bacterium]
MKRFVLATIAAVGVFGAACLLSRQATAQVLPPDMLVDQYMMEAQQALEDTTIRPISRFRAAISTYKRIEGLDVEPPPEIYFFYGKVLFESDKNGDNTSRFSFYLWRLGEHNPNRV